MTTTLTVPLDDGDVTLAVTGLDRAAWSVLVDQHPSSDPRWQWDHDTLAPALIRACVVDPLLDEGLAGQLCDDPDIGPDLLDLCFRLSEPGTWEWARRRLEKDARLAAEVAASVRMGIPHSQFAGWPARDQDLALAHLELTRDVCPGCGIPTSEMRREGVWEARHRDCWGCIELEAGRKMVPEDERYHVHVDLVRSGVT
jgi:hypothetical protein